VQYMSVKWKLLILTLLLVGGCAALVERHPEESLRQRVAERWSALIDGRLDEAYLFETPEYRKVYSYGHFRKGVHSGVGVWRKAEVEDIACKENKCVVTVRVYVRIVFGRGFGSTESSSPVKEHWIRSSSTDEWYHVSDQ